MFVVVILVLFVIYTVLFLLIRVGLLVFLLVLMEMTLLWRTRVCLL